MNDTLKALIDLAENANRLTESEKNDLQSTAKSIDKTLSIAAFKIERLQKDKRALTVLLQETIDELEHKRKAVEAQNRELEIEASLERVRTKTMAMQKSDELFEVIKTIYDEFQKLGFDALVADLMIFTEDKKGYDIWLYGAYGGEGPYRTSDTFFNHPHHQGTMNGWINGEELRITELKDDVFTSYFKIVLDDITGLICLSEEDKNKIFSLGHIIHTEVFTKHGCIRVGSLEKRTGTQLDIQKRFAKVFDQSYTRFLDLKKAEAQAREAQIELGLERVRARAMAMQNSVELAELVDTVFKELRKLDFSLTRCIIWIFDVDASGSGVWSANSEIDKTPNSYYIKFLDHPRHQTMISEWKARTPKFIYELMGDEKRSDDYRMLHETELRHLPEEVKAGMMESERVFLNYSFSSFGCLQADTLEPLPNESLDIIYRFAKVFDLTFTRFNDLQKAEAQAREAQIELGLERVRARAMAMHNSDELKELVKTLFVELTGLDVNLSTCMIWTCNPATLDARVWIFHPVTREPNAYVIQYNEDTFYQELLRAWKERNANWIYCLEGDAKIKWEKFIFSDTGFSLLPEVVKDEMRKHDKVFFSAAYYKSGAIQAAGLAPFSKQNIDILQRFSKVFDLSYTRFLDLQKAEAQAREAQIELGLERVRARAMAMQKSEELKELIGTVFTELTKLDIVLTRCLIMIYNTGTNGSTWWMANAEAPSDPIGLYIKNHEHKPYLAYINAWRQREYKWQYILEGEDKKEWDDFLFVETELSLLPDFVIAGMKEPERVYLNASFNSFGNLTLASLEPLSTEHFDILLRFARVFDLTYTRFNDLKQAEAQAREAKIEAALERVRSRAMAMHKSEELLDAGELLYKELTKLGIVSFTTGYVLMDEEEKFGWIYAASPADGTLLPEPTGLPHDSEAMGSIKASWKKQEPFYVVELDPKATIEHHTYLAKNSINFLFTLEEFLAISPKGVVLHSFNFRQGYILVVTEVRLTPDQEEMVVRFTKVFEMTYRRFLDLKQAEAQAREAKIEAALERVRAGAMAMHKSEELGNVASLMFDQIRLFEGELWA
ncbi:MAG: hypothetical protein JWR18_2430, partial [Segetibacter sp.]|nr:hypothetical protein [Segetibacter sp.]